MPLPWYNQPLVFRHPHPYLRRLRCHLRGSRQALVFRGHRCHSGDSFIARMARARRSEGALVPLPDWAVALRPLGEHRPGLPQPAHGILTTSAGWRISKDVWARLLRAGLDQ